MVYGKGIVFLTTLCIVNAAVIINVYDDGPYSPHVQKQTDCNALECEQMCRRIGFPGGACVGNHCKCDLLQKTEDLELSGLRQCNYHTCEQLCRRMGYVGGTCIGDRCQCDTVQLVKVTKAASVENDIKEVNNSLINNTEEPADCSSLECKIMCKQVGSPGGTCERGACNCDKFEANHEISKRNYVRTCDPIACSFLCIEQHYIFGECKDGKCQCF